VTRRVAAALLPAVFVLVFSSGYIAGTFGVRDAHPLALVAWRALTALVVLGVITLVTRAPWPRRARDWGHLLITGVLLQTVQLAGVYLSLGLGVPAGLASLILALCPLVVAAAAVPLFGERLSGWQWAGTALGLGGVALSLSENLSGGSHRLAGYALAVAALAGFASGTLYQKRFGATADLRSGTTIQLIGTTVTAFPLAALHGGVRLALTPASAAAVAWLAVVNSIGAFTLLFLMLRRQSGAAATSLLYLVPPVTALLAAGLLGEPLTVSVLAGMAVSGVGVILVSARRPGRWPPPGRPAPQADGVLAQRPHPGGPGGSGQPGHPGPGGGPPPGRSSSPPARSRWPPPGR
jgi:drug/metabolite transporter (DMT)-like permease